MEGSFGIDPLIQKFHAISANIANWSVDVLPIHGTIFFVLSSRTGSPMRVVPIVGGGIGGGVGNAYLVQAVHEECGTKLSRLL